MDDLLEYHGELFDLCAIGAEANHAFPQESFLILLATSLVMQGY